MYSDYDAIVVGARPAGAATAMLLARAGRRVLMMDRGTYGSDTLSTHALMRAGVVQLSRWGLLDAIRAAGTPPVRGAAFHYGDDVIEVAIRPQPDVDALYAPRRTVLDRVLVDAARDAGVDVHYGVSVTGLRHDASGRVTGVRARTPASDHATASAPIVIGADGMRSTVARLVDAPIDHSDDRTGAYVYGYFSGIADDQYQWYFRPGATAGVIPTNDRLANVFVGTSPQRFESWRTEPTESVFRSVLADAAPDVARALAGQAPVERFHRFPGHGGFLRRAHGRGWALVGDAGSFKDPLSSHGISDALRDAELLARALLATPASAPDASAYQPTRDELALPMMRTTAAIGTHRWDLPTVQMLHRELKAINDAEVEMLTGWDEAPALVA
jgi:flavin-dependent dehydrogenase